MKFKYIHYFNRKKINLSVYYLIFFMDLFKYLNILNKLQNLYFFFKQFSVFKYILIFILNLKKKLIYVFLKLFFKYKDKYKYKLLSKERRSSYFAKFKKKRNKFINTYLLYANRVWNKSFTKTFYFCKNINKILNSFIFKNIKLIIFYIKILNNIFIIKSVFLPFKLFAINLLFKNNKLQIIHFKQYFNFFFFKFSLKFSHLFNSEYIIDNISYLNFFNLAILRFYVFESKSSPINYNQFKINNQLKYKTRNKFKYKFILFNKYYRYILDFNLDKKKFFYNFYQNNYSFNAFIKKLYLVKKNTIKLFKNNIYLKKNYAFISIKFFKLYLNIILLWYFNTNLKKIKYNKIYRNIFIMYVKHLNFSFFTKYLFWINKSKKIVITLNANIKKNNLFYTLVNKEGKTLSNISTGLFYFLPRNKNLKKNPFKKSISYLAFEMFSVFFHNKFIHPLRNYKVARKWKYFKLNDSNIEDYLLIKQKNKKNFKLLRNKKLRIYFIFKFLKQKYFFPGLSKNLKFLIGNRRKKDKWSRSLYSFVGVYKMYPRVHNGCRKKKKRRL